MPRASGVCSELAGITVVVECSKTLENYKEKLPGEKKAHHLKHSQRSHLGVGQARWPGGI